MGKSISYFGLVAMGVGCMLGTSWLLLTGTWLETAGGPLNLAVAFLGFALQSLSFGIFTPVSVFFINQELKEKDRIVGQTIFGMVTVGVGSCVGNLAGGFLMDRIGLRPTLGLCVVFAAVGFLITQRVKVEDTGPRRRILQVETAGPGKERGRR